MQAMRGWGWEPGSAPALVLALEEAEEEGRGEEHDGAGARGQAGGELHGNEGRRVVGDGGDERELAAEERDGREGEQVGRHVEQVLRRAQELEVIGCKVANGVADAQRGSRVCERVRAMRPCSGARGLCFAHRGAAATRRC